MRVDIWSDVICPWCYVGKARFSQALGAFAHRDEVEVVYRSFELDPSYPKDRHETTLAMLSGKYGMSEADARAAESRIAGLAAAEGLGFEPVRPVGNTFDIHRVLHLGLAKGVQADLVRAVDQAYFAQGRPVFDPDVITGIAAEAGLDAGLTGDVIDGDAYAEQVGRRAAGAPARHHRRPVLRIRHGARCLRRAVDRGTGQRVAAGVGTARLTAPGGPTW
jgi:predicted DsbA family dithiol-disulfide isomerase